MTPEALARHGHIFHRAEHRLGLVMARLHGKALLADGDAFLILDLENSVTAHQLAAVAADAAGLDGLDVVDGLAILPVPAEDLETLLLVVAPHLVADLKSTDEPGHPTIIITADPSPDGKEEASLSFTVALTRRENTSPRARP